MDRLPGFRDFYPEPVPPGDNLAWSADARAHVFAAWRHTARCYGFREYDGPPVESLDLYTVKSGEEIVGQLYNFTDKGDRRVALRPEMTPTLARMVAAHERDYKKPIKWFAIPQLFRYERQQKGRLREHFQFNADILGETSVAADAELIALLIDALRALGLSAADFQVRISSRNAWQEFYQRGAANAEAGGAGEYEFFQIIDKLERIPEDESRKKLAALGFALEAVKDFIAAARPTIELQAVLDNLRARGRGDFVAVDYHVIRGLAYYTGVVFEAFDRQGEFRAIAGGGRYDNLVHLISGGKIQLPALGFGMGDVVLLELLKARGLLPRFSGAVAVYCLVEDETLRADSLALVQQARDAGLAVDYPLTPTKPEKQFKRARELGVTHLITVERNDAGEKSVRVKHVPTRAQQSVPFTAAVAALTAELPPGR